MIYSVLSNFDFVAKFTVKNLNKDFIKAVRGGHRFMKVFHKIPVFFEGWLPLVLWIIFLPLTKSAQCSKTRVLSFLEWT